MRSAISEVVAAEREHILGEFSLDNKQGALSRLVGELTEENGELKRGFVPKSNLKFGDPLIGSEIFFWNPFNVVLLKPRTPERHHCNINGVSVRGVVEPFLSASSEKQRQTVLAVHAVHGDHRLTRFYCIGDVPRCNEVCQSNVPLHKRPPRLTRADIWRRTFYFLTNS